MSIAVLCFVSISFLYYAVVANRLTISSLLARVAELEKQLLPDESIGILDHSEFLLNMIKSYPGKVNPEVYTITPDTKCSTTTSEPPPHD